ncbi:MAG: AAA family ATPase, partial [Phycisphaerae bacterium]
MRTLTIANQKGGCGKTTTSVNLAAALAKRNKSVLLIDLDPQGHSTLGVGHNPDSFPATIYNVMSNPEVSISSVITGTVIPKLNLVPNNILLSG